jgi:hypothetical protein
MKIKLLIATADHDYAEHLSNVLAEKHADAFEVAVSSTAAQLDDLLAARKFDVALLDASFIAGADFSAVRLALVLRDESGPLAGPAGDLRKIRKYRRISSIAGDILANYAEEFGATDGVAAKKAHITAVWSPAGGVGKTTVALAYATRKAADGKQVLYLDLEHFSSTPLYFAETGPSISSIFEKLDGAAGLLVRGIRQLDSGTGVAYFCHAENYDDLNILTAEDIAALMAACSAGTDELVIDLPCLCDERVRRILDFADRVLLVTDNTTTARAKLRQFMSQHNVFERVRAKTALIANKGAPGGESPVDTVIGLPLVPAGDAVAVYKALSGNRFEM